MIESLHTADSLLTAALEALERLAEVEGSGYVFDAAEDAADLLRAAGPNGYESSADVMLDLAGRVCEDVGRVYGYGDMLHLAPPMGSLTLNHVAAQLRLAATVLR
jgi:hypothetical protein